MADNKTTKTKIDQATIDGYTKQGLKVSSVSIHLQQGSDRGLYVQFKFPDKPKDQVRGFQLDWEVASSKTNDGKFRWGDISGNVSTPSWDEAYVGNDWFRVAWTVPDAAIVARVKITPISESRDKVVAITTYSDGSKTQTKQSFPYFTATTVTSENHNFLKDGLDAPTVTAELEDDGRTWDVTVESDDEDANFCDVQMSYTPQSNWDTVESKTERKMDGPKTVKFYTKMGQSVYFRARVSTVKNKYDSDWAYVEGGITKPKKPENVVAMGNGADSISVKWDACDLAASYTVERVSGNKDYFVTNPELVTRTTGITATAFTPTGLESAVEWFFRVCAVNDAGESSWSSIVHAVTATRPEAPTVYPLEGVYMKDDTVLVRWAHNSEDKSEQTEATIEVIAENTTSHVVEGNQMWHELDLSKAKYADGTKVKVHVKTKGAHAEYGPWSEYVTFTVYSEVSLSVQLRSGALRQFPLYITLDAAGGGNDVVGYDISIVPEVAISYIDDYGITRRLAEGMSVWRMHVDTDYDPCVVAVGSGAVNLVDGGIYRVDAGVAMASGLSARESSISFLVDFDSSVPLPEADVEFHENSLTASITPYCRLRDSQGFPMDSLRSGTELAVYRIDTAGVITLLEGGIANNRMYTVDDPHPPFGEAWYHIVAKDTATGVCSFSDVMCDSTHHSCVIQWGEGEAATDERGAYTGKTIDGLYNRTFSEKANVKKTMVDYQGRKRSVSYYGSGLGETITYDCEFPAEDTRKLGLIRELKALQDDCYIRESSGVGYWATIDDISVSISTDSLQKVSVSISATPVDRYDGVRTSDDEAEDVTVTRG